MIAVVILNWNGVDMLRRYLPGVVSRKKQMIPPLRMAMQAEA